MIVKGGVFLLENFISSSAESDCFLTHKIPPIHNALACPMKLIGRSNSQLLCS